MEQITELLTRIAAALEDSNTLARQFMVMQERWQQDEKKRHASLIEMTERHHLDGARVSEEVARSYQESLLKRLGIEDDEPV